MGKKWLLLGTLSQIRFQHIVIKGIVSLPWRSFSIAFYTYWVACNAKSFATAYYFAFACNRSFTIAFLFFFLFHFPDGVSVIYWQKLFRAFFFYSYFVRLGPRSTLLKWHAVCFQIMSFRDNTNDGFTWPCGILLFNH